MRSFQPSFFGSFAFIIRLGSAWLALYPPIYSFQIDDSILWTALFALLAQLGATGSLSASTYVNAIAGRGLLVLCFNLRKSAPVFEAANQLISSWMARWLQPSLHDPFGAIVTLVRSIPVDLTELGPWIGRQGDSVPFASKCAALLLLYHLELSADYK